MSGKDGDELQTSKSLIQQIKANSSDAWERLCHIYTPLVYSWVRRAGLPPEDAADVVQEVFRAVNRGIARFRHEKADDTFRGWLLTITRNEIRGWFRQQNKVVSSGAGGTAANLQLAQVPDWVDSDEDLEDDVSTQNELVRRAADLVKQDFSPHTWQAFWHTVVDGRPATEVAKELKMSAGAVRQARFRVLARLREVLD